MTGQMWCGLSLIGLGVIMWIVAQLTGDDPDEEGCLPILLIVFGIWMLADAFE